MSDKIYELYKEYEKFPLTNSFIKNAFNLMMEKETELTPYINAMFISNKLKDVLGSYSNEQRIIRINKELISQQPNNQKILALQVLKHEIEHARNLKILYDAKDDIESKTVYYSLRGYALKHNIDPHFNIDNLIDTYLIFVTEKNYDINPGERLADIKANKYIVNLLKNQRDSDELLIARAKLYYAYIRGYKDNNYYLDPPTYEFLLKTGMYHDYYWLKQRVEKKDYSFDTRITYGLPITYEEYNSKVLNKVKLYKRTIQQNTDRRTYE
jgi:hypothetical protein